MTSDEKLDAIMGMLTTLNKKLSAAPTAKAPAIEPSDDKDLDGQYGDPVVKKDPPKWKGDSFIGCKLSECSVEFLESFAGFKAWQASKDDEKGTDEDGKKAWYSRKDAARALGWAIRIKNGWHASDRVKDAFPGTTTGDADMDDDIPF